MNSVSEPTSHVFLDRLKDQLANPHIGRRMAATGVTAIVLFTVITTAAYCFLPEGMLHRANPLQNWETSQDLWISTLQIFGFNLLSVLAILAGNLFAEKKGGQRYAFPYGLTAFFVLISMNALVLGTWSFAVVQPAVNLSLRLLRTFDLVHRAGLWEMTGQMLIACSTAGTARVITSDGITITRPFREIHLSNSEWFTLLTGLILMLCGAWIESNAILALG